MKKKIYLLAVIFFTPSLIWSAEIIKLNKKKNVFSVNEGKITGFEKGTTVCILDSDDKKLGCGKIVKAGRKKAFVKIRKKVFETLVIGMKVVLKTDLNLGKDKSKNLDSQQTKMKLKFIYSAAILAPTKFNRLIKSPAIISDSGVTVNPSQEYEVIKSSNSSLFEGGLEFEYLISKSFSLALGGRYSPYCEVGGGSFSCSSTYDSSKTTFADGTIPQDENRAYLVSQKLMGIGAWFDFYFLNIDFGSLIWKIGSGMDYEMTTIKMNVTEVDDTDEKFSNNVLSVTSKLSVLSLRLPMPFILNFGGADLFFGPLLYIPLVELGFSQSLNPTSTQNFNQYLNHHKNTFGLVFTTGLSLLF